MKTFRYFILALFAFAPMIVQAQEDSIRVSLTSLPGDVFQAVGADFGAQFTEGLTVGPVELVQAEPFEACEPITNAAELEGKVAFISRGSCAFVIKGENAANAGAIAWVLTNNDADNPEQFITPIGDCEPDVCSIPVAVVTFNSGQIIETEVKFGTEVVIDPVRILAPPPPSSFGVHETGVITMSVYDYGFLGASAALRFLLPGEGIPFDFIVDEDTTTGGLFVSTVLVAQGETVNTNPYTEGPPEFVNVDDVIAITDPPAPFDQAFQTSYMSNQLGVMVTQRSYSRAGDPFVIVDLEVENTSSSTLEDVYVGIFADWDADEDGDGPDASTDDSAGYNEDLLVPYVFDGDQYYGVTAFVDELSGYSTDVSGIDGDFGNATDEELLSGLTDDIDPLPGEAERAAVTGTGPYTMEAGQSVTVRFAYVAGSDEDDFFANVAEARDVGAVSVEETTAAGTFVLESAYPNPFSSTTTIGFELPDAQDVNLVVYDVLGRTVATLVDGVRQAGPQTVEFDASALPSGTYIYRLEAGATQLTQRLTVVR